MDELQTFTEKFLYFIAAVIERFCNVEHGVPHEMPITVDYDPFIPENAERLSLDIWNAKAPHWAAVESGHTYLATMLSLLVKISALQLPKNRKVRILSVGTGPGLYEIFLAHWFHSRNIQVRIFSVDYAFGMTAFQKAVLESDLNVKGVRPRVLQNDVTPITGDMMDLKRFRSTCDIVICNNSLQWVPKWRDAVKEISACMSPNGLRMLYLVIHPHAMTTTLGGRKMTLPLIKESDLFDLLEECRFQQKSQRIILGRPGTGQMATAVDRKFLELEQYPNGVETPWRELTERRRSITKLRIPQ